MKTRQLTLAAMFVALTLVVTALPSPPGALLKFTGFPVIMSGFVLGPWGGALVGAISDLLGYAIRASGPYYPGFTLTQALTGFIPAFLLGRARHTWLRLTVVILIGQWVTKVFLVSYFRFLAYGHPWKLLAVKAFWEQLIHAPVYAWAAEQILFGLEHAGLKERPGGAPRRESGPVPPADHTEGSTVEAPRGPAPHPETATP